MEQYGDITKISGYTAPIVDIITGGSPCQDLSVAGKRAGLAGERSGLFMEQIRIIKEMRDRCAGMGTDDVRPRYMVWENVPGAFSSNKGEDFRCVLEETARIADKTAAIPRPEGGRWSNSGCILGNGWLLLGEYTMRSFGECPSAENVSRLSQILEEKPHQKYSLSATACAGILRRAENRGKELPEPLKQALIRQSAFKSEQDARGAAKEY